MKHRAIGAIACLVALMPSFGLAEPPLGRLFYTPQQRARMDEARQQERTIKAEEEVEASPPPPNITLNGIVTRSDGKTVVWVNNRVQGGDSANGVAVTGKAGAGQVNIVTLKEKRTVPLKVGQSMDMNSGQVEEIYRRTPPRLPPKAADTENPAAAQNKQPAGKGDALDAPADAQGELPR